MFESIIKHQESEKLLQSKNVGGTELNGQPGHIDKSSADINYLLSPFNLIDCAD